MFQPRFARRAEQKYAIEARGEHRVSASGSRSALWWVGVLWAVFGAVRAGAQSVPTIQFAEPISLSVEGAHAEFDAYGRRFALSLVDNDRLIDKLPGARKAELASYRLVRGAVEGSAGSWVRLVQSPAGIEGAIWDGHDLYAVTRYERIADE